MYEIQKIRHNKIEIILNDHLMEGQLIRMVHQIGVLCNVHKFVHVLLDATALAPFHLRLFLSEFEYFDQYRDQIRRLAIVTNSNFDIKIWGLFKELDGTTLRRFAPSELEKARRWIFDDEPSGGTSKLAQLHFNTPEAERMHIRLN